MVSARESQFTQDVMKISLLNYFSMYMIVNMCFWAVLGLLVTTLMLPSQTVLTNVASLEQEQLHFTHIWTNTPNLCMFMFFFFMYNH